MQIEHFPLFIAKIFPEAYKQGTTEELKEIGVIFQEYLNKKFKGKEDMLKEISDINPINIIEHFGTPLRPLGYHPALILHMSQFAEEQKEQLEKEEKNE
jgi:hypothetical protein